MKTKSTTGSLQKKATSNSKTAPDVVSPDPSKLKRKKPEKTLPDSAVSIPAIDKNTFPVVAIGASAGGLEAVTQLLQNLSPTTGMAFIYVQHLSPDHKSMLTPLLSRVTKMAVQEIDDMEMMKPNNVYVIPYNKDIEVIDGHIQLLPRLRNKSYNQSIDVLFSSLAETHKENVVGIVLSGSAHDGTRGLKEIKLAGGITFAQDDSAKFSSMPNSAIAEGVVDFVLSPKEIGRKLNWMSKHPLLKRNTVAVVQENEIENNNPDLKRILQVLFKVKQVDFSHYKMNTIKRRMLRRMLLLKVKTIKQYSGLLSEKPEEVELLYQDLLINVTDFFRDPEAFLLLKNTVLPKLLQSKAEGEKLRIWVAACASGEEVYSIAMTMFEIVGNKSGAESFQIFGTDLSQGAINEARNGEYRLQQLKNVSPERLSTFFVKVKDKYRISKRLRDVCVFAVQNILSDPPFSRIDFISCRNFLIYLDAIAQKKAIATFHYALNNGGCLMLGKSEAIGDAAQSFSTFNKKFKVYNRKKDSSNYKMPEINLRISTTVPTEKSNTAAFHSKKNPESGNSGLSSAFEALLLAHFMPASVIINHDLEILQFRGPTGLYLQNAPGKASFNILKMAPLELTFELRNAIHHAIKTRQTVRKTGLELTRDFNTNTVHVIDLAVMPLTVDGEEPMLVVVFNGQQVEIQEHPENDGKYNSIAKDRRVKKLEEALSAARADMGAITQDQEAANEELQIANEEIISSNEELQSLNEELETSKEEIESTNEELTTSNLELQARIQEVEELYAYYEAILSTVHEPVVILDKNICIKSVNISFCKTFRVKESDCIGVSLYKLGNNQWDIPRLRELLEDIVPKNVRFHDFEVEHTFPLIGLKTMLLNAHRIFQQSKNEELIVLTIADITDVKRLAIELQVKEKKRLEIAKRLAEQKMQIAEDAVKAKQQFLSNMSHEIRTPMNAIIGFTNVVLKSKLDDTQKEYINAIKVSGEALVILINDILDLAKVDAGKMTFEHVPFNLFDAISTTLHLFESKIAEKNLILIKEYDPAIPPVLLGDPIRLRQILLNLVGNAVKFTNAGSITLGVKLLKTDAGSSAIEFSLSDTGIGIASGSLGKIFNNFEQAGKETTSAYGGTGLGLAIVKQLLELQGGSITVKSQLGKGSTFSFVLQFENTLASVPLQKVFGPETDYKNALEGQEKSAVKVLVAEDMALNQLLIKILLLDFGFEIEIVGNGKEAIEKLRQNNYDIVLMDLQMPEMNGFDATQYIRHEMKSSIPIIALTADVTTIDIEKCKQAGMDDYISKPIDEQLLYSKMIKCLKNQDSL